MLRHIQNQLSHHDQEINLHFHHVMIQIPIHLIRSKLLHQLSHYLILYLQLLLQYRLQMISIDEPILIIITRAQSSVNRL